MISYERGILQMPLCSQARMEPGSLLCKTHECINEITTWAQEHIVKLFFFFFPFNILFTNPFAVASGIQWLPGE